MGAFREWVTEQVGRLKPDFSKLESALSTLAGQITKPLNDKVDEVKLWVAAKITEGLVKMLDTVAAAGKDVTKSYVESVIAKSGMPPEAKTVLDSWLKHKGEFGAGIPDIMLGFYLSGLLSAISEPLFYQLSTETWERLRWRNPPLEDVVRMNWRGLVSDSEVDRVVKEAGFNETFLKGYKEVLRYYPSPTDFIRFAVRDTFNEAVVKKYAYDTDYPTTIDAQVAKAGMSPEWMIHYWRAHWELPSPTQAFEMLHRGAITLEDIRILLRIADVAPYFIEPFIKISYNPVTRVDLRRLYQSGIYNRDQVKAGYLALGSDPEIAEYLTQWTEQEYGPKDRDLTKAEILNQYDIGLLTRDETRESLAAIDYSDVTINLILAQEDYKLDVQKFENEAETVIAEIIAGTINLAEAEEKFKMLKLTQKAKTAYLNRAKQEVRKLQHVPSIDTLKTWLEKGVITEAVFRERMSANKVTSEDIDKYIKEVLAS